MCEFVRACFKLSTFVVLPTVAVAIPIVRLGPFVYVKKKSIYLLGPPFILVHVDFKVATETCNRELLGRHSAAFVFDFRMLCKLKKKKRHEMPVAGVSESPVRSNFGSRFYFGQQSIESTEYNQLEFQRWQTNRQMQK